MKKSDELAIKENLLRLRGEPALPPEASIIIPVNAQNDLQNVLRLIRDITAYQGKRRLETILVINNYPPVSPPEEIVKYRALGLRVPAFPNVKARNEIYLTARVFGARDASSECTIYFDADCRLPNATALIDWYIEQFEAGFQLAYTHVRYYDLPPSAAMKARMLLYETFRWFKRVILQSPISRGSNYAMARSLMLALHDRGLLKYDIKVGPTVKSVGGRIAYSGDRSLAVLTSGRNFRGDWHELFEYITWRARYYRRVHPMRPDGARPNPRSRG